MVPSFNSQPLYSSSEPCIALGPLNLMPSSDLLVQQEGTWYVNIDTDKMPMHLK